jgi:hypothetical protein
LRGFLWRLYAYAFAQDFVLIYPLYAVMFAEHGLTPGQIGLAFMVWSTVGFVLEAPSGVIADRYPRRTILWIAQLIRAAGYACWWLVPGVWGAVAGFALWGVKSAFTSGCYEALIYDELKAAGREADYAEVLGRTKAVANTAVMLASTAAALAAPLGYAPLLIASVAAGVVAAALAASFPRAPPAEAVHERGYLAHMALGLRQALSSRPILALIVFLSLLVCAAGSIDEFWPIFGREAGLGHAGVSLMFTAVSAAMIPAGAFAHRLVRLPQRALHALVAAMGVMLLVAAWVLRPWTAVLIVLFSAGYVLVSTVFEARLQDEIPSETRATVSSIAGVAIELGVMGVYGGFGLIAQLSDYRHAFLAFGGFTLAMGLVYLARPLKAGRAR